MSETELGGIRIVRESIEASGFTAGALDGSLAAVGPMHRRRVTALVAQGGGTDEVKIDGAMYAVEVVRAGNAINVLIKTP